MPDSETMTASEHQSRFAASSPAMNGDTASPPLVEQAKQQAHRVLEQTQQKAGQAIDDARDKTKSWIDHQKEATAENLHDVADAVRATGSSLRQGNKPVGSYADFTDGLADAVENASQYLRNTNIETVAGEVERFARRQPVAFIGIAFGLGFLAARFLKSSHANTTQGRVGINPDRSLPVVMDSQTGAEANYGTGTTG
jgi:ElaB/YqjD/DUF883 family membrane-anchored ribosome-binding protein